MSWQQEIPAAFEKGSVSWAIWLTDTVPIRELDQVTPILDKHKDEVMKYLLNLIYSIGITDKMVRDTIDSLARSRVRWPELEVVQRSLHSEQMRRFNDMKKLGLPPG